MLNGFRFPGRTLVGNFIRRVKFLKKRGLITTHHFNTVRYTLRKEALQMAVFYTYGAEVEGDIAEFGTGWGESAKVIAHAMKECEGIGRIFGKHLDFYDSFEGFPEPEAPEDLVSPHVISGVWKKGTAKDVTQKQLLKACSKYIPKERINIYPGWYKDTLPNIKNKNYSLVHIDCDLYQSIKEVLDALFSKNMINEGTMIIFDDWNCNRASPKYGARLAFQEAIQKYNITYSEIGGYAWACIKFVIHNYKAK